MPDTPKKKVAVVAVGGNSLIKDAQHQSIPDQYAASVESMKHIAGMIEAGWEVVITHGNGPQVGFILRRAELALSELHMVPLDYCGADTQGAIGYMFQRALYNEFRARGHRQAGGDRRDPDAGRPERSGLPESEQADRLLHGRGHGQAAPGAGRLGGGRGCRARLAAGRPFAAPAAHHRAAGDR